MCFWLMFNPLFSPSDGDTVEIRVGADGKTLHIRDNQAADEPIKVSATPERGQ